MSDEKITHLNDKRRDRDGSSIKVAIKRAKQHIRNVVAGTLYVLARFSSGHMKKYLEDQDKK